MAGNVDHDALTLQLLEFIPSATPEQATQYLSANNWDIDAAAAALMADMEEAEAEAEAPAEASSSASQPAPPEYTGPRTLDGRPAPQYASSSSSNKPAQQKKKGLATLSSLGGGSSHDHDDADSDDDDDDQHGPRDTYAGGEKSGLAVQDPSQRGNDPKRIINDLLAKAKSQTARPDASSPSGSVASSSFRGSGQTLGGEGVASRTIPDPLGPIPSRSQPAPNAPVQERTLHIWTDGFSIDDGPLRRYDDPQNADALRMIEQGRAPVHLMNVRYDEPLDVKLQNHNEAYRPLPKVYKPFGGEGRRLGSPVPGESSGAGAGASMTATTAATTPSTMSTSAPFPADAEDDGEPRTKIKIRYLDGTSKSVAFKLSQTIDDIYDFVRRSEPGMQTTSWNLFIPPPGPIEFKTDEDKKRTLGEIGALKRGGVIVVKRS